MGLADMFGTGQNAWIEDYPAPSADIPMPVRVGDSMDVDIKQVSGAQWLVDVTDNGETRIYQDAYAPNQSTAEWIFEDDSHCTYVSHVAIGSVCEQYALAQTYPVQFANCWAKTADGRTLTPADGERVVMTSDGTTGGQQMAYPSGSYGQSFTVFNTAT